MPDALLILLLRKKILFYGLKVYSLRSLRAANQFLSSNLLSTALAFHFLALCRLDRFYLQLTRSQKNSKLYNIFVLVLERGLLYKPPFKQCRSVLLVLNYCMCSRQPGDRYAKRRTRYIIHVNVMAKDN